MQAAAQGQQLRCPHMGSTGFTVDEASAGQTLAAVLRQIRPGMSWGDARREIAARRVRIGGTVCVDDARRVSVGEVIAIGSVSAPPPPRAEKLHLLHIDEHLVVVEKPAGVLAERRREEEAWDDARKRRQSTLDELLAERLGGGARLRGGEVFAVHRLDRDTSGLMLYALSPAASAALIALFAAHKVQRSYLAVVNGHLQAMDIHSQLVRDRGDGIRGSLPQGKTDAASKKAVTHVQPLEELGAYSLVQCRLQTGRTHQIRIHLCEAGHPLCGDRIYTHRLGEPALRDQSHAPRLALHSTELSFTHPFTRQAMRFESPLPRDLSRWLQTLRTQDRQSL